MIRFRKYGNHRFTEGDIFQCRTGPKMIVKHGDNYVVVNLDSWKSWGESRSIDILMERFTDSNPIFIGRIEVEDESFPRCI